MTHSFRFTLALGASLFLAGCGGMPTNRGIENIHQPVVTHDRYVLDVTTQAGGGLAPSEAARLSGWFEALGLGGSDRLALTDPEGAIATRSAIAEIAARHGLLMAEAASRDPATPDLPEGPLAPGSVRVVVVRAMASVPGCPDWSAHSDANFTNGTSTNYGCAMAANLAAMVDNKDDLVRGQHGTSRTQAQINTKAIEAWRNKAPTGNGELKQVATKSAGGN